MSEEASYSIRVSKNTYNYLMKIKKENPFLKTVDAVIIFLISKTPKEVKA
jgi:hypothetical protein